MAAGVRDDVGHEYTCFMRGVKTHVCMNDLVVGGLGPSLGSCNYQGWLLLYSMVVALPMVSNPTFVTLPSFKAFFVNGLKNE